MPQPLNGQIEGLRGGQLLPHPATLADALHVAFWWSAGFSAVAMLLCLWLPGVQRKLKASLDSVPSRAAVARG